MFGLKSLFAALNRLVAAINDSAEIFEKANEVLAARLVVDGEEGSETAAIEDNGKVKRLRVK